MIIDKIREAFIENKDNKSKNSMGCSESYYNPYYLVGKCFPEKKLEEMDEEHLEDLIKLATFAGDVFY